MGHISLDDWNQLVFGQLATEAKSNEIKAIPKLLKLLDLNGATVTIDAIGCQKAIAGQLVEQGADYVLAVKTNQPLLHEELTDYLDALIKSAPGTLAFHQVVDGDHGRIETRRCWATWEIDWFENRHDWPGLNCFAAVECERIVGDQTSTERRYFISSLKAIGAETIAHAVRSHLGIENSLHWSLDVSFSEDQSRVRKGHTAENLSRLRRVALNLLKQEKPSKVGIKNRRLRAGWDNDYLLRVLQL